MELSHTFTVNLPVRDAWPMLTEPERIARCLPGATLDGVRDEEYHGSLDVRIASARATYRGTARFVERDENAHTAVLRAEGDDGGHGQASARLRARLVEQGNGTKVDLRIELAVSGGPVNAGHGIVADLVARMLGQFLRQLEAETTAPAPEVRSRPAGEDARSAEPPPPEVHQRAPDTGGILVRWAWPAAVAGALAAGVLLGRRTHHQARRGKVTR